MAEETPYDAMAYPSSVFLQTHPNRLAVLARLHGLTPPDVETARVLEIGGGDGLNLLSMAAAFPHARFFNFDLAPRPVERGAKLAVAAGLTNIRIEVGDIMNMAGKIPAGSYEYIIAHGVYAWVPDAVRDATMALIGHALSPDGVAFVSFNAHPGGNIRMVMRQMLRHALTGIEGHRDRIAAARAFLSDYQQAREGDDIVVQSIRAQAVSMLTRPDEVLFHDELGDWFSPQLLSDAVADGARNGLRFLTDAGANLTTSGFLPAGYAGGDDTTADVVGLAQADDFLQMRFFRQPLFVRDAVAPKRLPDIEALLDLHVAGWYEDLGNGEIKAGDATISTQNPDLIEALQTIAAHWPRYQPLRAVTTNPDIALALLELFHTGSAFLSTTPERFTREIADRPIVSPLVRAQIAMGESMICTLSHETMTLTDPSARGLVAAMDGTRDRAALQAVWATLPHRPEVILEMALAAVAHQRLLLPV